MLFVCLLVSDFIIRDFRLEDPTRTTTRTSLTVFRLFSKNSHPPERFFFLLLPEKLTRLFSLNGVIKP